MCVSACMVINTHMHVQSFHVCELQRPAGREMNTLSWDPFSHLILLIKGNRSRKLSNRTNSPHQDSTPQQAAVHSLFSTLTFAAAQVWALSAKSFRFCTMIHNCRLTHASVWTLGYGHFSLSESCSRKNSNGMVCWFQQDENSNIIPAALLVRKLLHSAQ